MKVKWESNEKNLETDSYESDRSLRSKKTEKERIDWLNRLDNKGRINVSEITRKLAALFQLWW